MRKEFKSILGYIYPGLIFILIILTQFLQDTNNLPKGFESAKVSFIQSIGFIISITLPIYLIFKIYENKTRFTFNISLIALLSLTVISIVLITISIISSPFSQTALVGSEFRFIGLLTIIDLHLIFIFFLFVNTRSSLKAYIHIYLLAGLWQFFWAIQQATQLSWPVIRQGYYVNGAFGQANFFGAQMASCFVISLYLLFFSNYKFKFINTANLIITFNAVLKFSYFLLACFFLGGLILSFSNGPWGVAVFISTIILLNTILVLAKISLGFLNVFLSQKLVDFLAIKIKFLDKYIKYIVYALLVALFALAALLFTYNNDLSRKLIWDGVIQLIKKRPLLGYGPDTLILALQQNGLLLDRIIDRSHNFYLDLIVHFGLIWFFLSIVAAGWLAIKIAVQKTSKDIAPFILALLTFLLCGLVDTKSAYQYAELAMLLGLIAGYYIRQNNSPLI